MSEHAKSSVTVAAPAGALESGAGPSTSATTQLAQAVPGGWLLSGGGVPVLDWNGQRVRLEPGQPAVTLGGPIPDGLRAHLQARADMYGQIDAYPDAGDLVLLYRAAAPVTSEAVPYFTPLHVRGHPDGIDRRSVRCDHRGRRGFHPVADRDQRRRPRCDVRGDPDHSGRAAGDCRQPFGTADDHQRCRCHYHQETIAVTAAMHKGAGESDTVVAGLIMTQAGLAAVTAEPSRSWPNGRSGR